MIMKLQEQGLISLEFINRTLLELKSHIKDRRYNDEKWYKQYEEEIERWEDLKEQLISPIPLAEKIWDEASNSSFNHTVKVDEDYYLNEIPLQEDKDNFLNSNIII